jgi:hypothetical protein
VEGAPDLWVKAFLVPEAVDYTLDDLGLVFSFEHPGNVLRLAISQDPLNVAQLQAHQFLQRWERQLGLPRYILDCGSVGDRQSHSRFMSSVRA